MGVDQVLILIIFGLLAGTIGSLAGIGGGILIVPFLLLLYNLEPQAAVATSLTIIFFLALSATFSYAAQKRIDYSRGLTFAVMAVPGAIIGVGVSDLCPLNIFQIILGVLLLLVAIRLLIKKWGRFDPAGQGGRDINDPEKSQKPPARGFIYILGFFGGFLAGFLGIGGGILYVPILIYLVGLPVHRATATSVFIIAIASFFGSLYHFKLAHIEFYYLLWIGAGGVIGAKLGAVLSENVTGTLIMRVLAAILVLTGLRLLFINIT